MSDHRPLVDLINTMFSPDEWRIWIRANYETIVNHLPAPQASAFNVITVSIETLERRGEVDAKFFDNLASERPKRLDDINAERARWFSPILEPERAPASRTPPPVTRIEATVDNDGSSDSGVLSDTRIRFGRAIERRKTLRRSGLDTSEIDDDIVKLRQEIRGVNDGFPSSTMLRRVGQPRWFSLRLRIGCLSLVAALGFIGIAWITFELEKHPIDLSMRAEEGPIATQSLPPYIPVELSPSDGDSADPVPPSPISEPRPRPKPSGGTSKDPYEKRRDEAEAADPGRIIVELEMLSAAKRSLKHDPTKALAYINQHSKEFPTSQLIDQFDEVKIKAMCALGRTAQARSEAVSILKRRPNSRVAAAIKLCT